MSEKLVCHQDSIIAREMVEHNLAYGDRPFGLHLVGITAHVYADTFSHYGFSGVSSRRNRVDYDSIELLNLNSDMEPYVNGKTEKFLNDFRMDALLENWREDLTDTIKSGIADFAAALGHGGALTHPDRPYLEWQFDYEYPEKKSSGIRRNPVTFLEGCEKLHAMFCRFGEQNPEFSLGDGRPFEEIRDAVKAVLETQAPYEGRIEAWKSAAENGALFAGSEEILPYLGEQWEAEIDGLERAENSEAALTTSVFRYFQAAAIHRIYVLRDLLPKHGIIAG